MERAQTKPYFVYMKRFILFVTKLFDLELVLKFQFSYVFRAGQNIWYIEIDLCISLNAAC